MDEATARPDVIGKITRGTPAFRRTNLGLFAAGFATFALLYCVQPLMPLLSADFGVSAVSASLALSLTTGFLAVSMLVASTLSEVWGRKPMMAASLLLSAILTMICAALPHWRTLLLVRALMGVTLSGLPAVAMAYVGEEMHPDSLGLAMGLYVGGSGLGGMAGRLLTGVITGLYGWRTALTVVSTIGVLCAAIMWRGLPASRHFVSREPHLPSLLRAFDRQLRDPALTLLFAEGFLLMGAFVTVYNYVGYRLLAPPFSLSQTDIGLIFAVYLCGIVSSAWVGGLAVRLGRGTVLPAALVLMLAGNLLTLSNSLSVIILGIAIATAGLFGGHSVASAWVGARAQTSKAQASSLYLFAYYLGGSVVGTLGGIFWRLGAWPAVIAMTSVLILVALGIAARLRVLAKQEAAMGRPAPVET